MKVRKGREGGGRPTVNAGAIGFGLAGCGAGRWKGGMVKGSGRGRHRVVLAWEDVEREGTGQDRRVGAAQEQGRVRRPKLALDHTNEGKPSTGNTPAMPQASLSRLMSSQSTDSLCDYLR